MTFNSNLQLIGVQKQIILSESEAKKLDAILNDKDYPPDFRLKIGGMNFKKSAVKYLEIIPDGGRQDAHQANAHVFYEEEKNNRKKYLSWSKQKLASYTDIFESLYQISTGQKPSAEEITRAKDIQFAFFQKNPRRTLCDLHLFKPIIPIRGGTLNVWESGFMGILERAVIRDMKLEK